MADGNPRQAIELGTQGCNGCCCASRRHAVGVWWLLLAGEELWDDVVGGIGCDGQRQGPGGDGEPGDGWLAVQQLSKRFCEG